MYIIRGASVDAMNGVKKIEILDRAYAVNDGVWSRGNYASARFENEIDRQPFSLEYIRTITMCLHISGRCNLKCKYCFGVECGDDLTFDEVRKFIEHVTVLYPRADRYIVDMSGAGEPLLRLDLILKIAEYCGELSDKYVREFLPTLVTNGTLLSADTVKKLQSAGVLFGVSLDGAKNDNDRNRVFADGSGSYDTVRSNIEAIEHKDYVGIATTYTDKSALLDGFLSSVELVPTVSMKPVRSNGKALDAERICAEYDRLVSYVLDKHIDGETKFIFALINGDDYFGKFLKRVACGISVYGRCDAGVGRFALAPDRNIYCCPAAIGNADCKVGDLENGIRQSKVDKMWRALNNRACSGCYARSACGGECKIVSYNKFGELDKIDDNICIIKRRLFALSVYYCDCLSERNAEQYNWLKDTALKAESYYMRDEKLIDAVLLSNGDYTFTQLKKIKDNDIDEFEKIYSRLKGG